jgi:hypothetical protein
VVNAKAAHNGTSYIAGNGKLVVDSDKDYPAEINGSGVIHLKSVGTLLWIGVGKGFILDGEVTIDGLMTQATADAQTITLPVGFADDSNNSRDLVIVEDHATNPGEFTMNGGVIGYNNGIGVGSGGIFNMHGGEITGNYWYSINGAAAIYVGARSVFTMYGGIISGNRANRGGGVYVTQGTIESVIYKGKFIMAGGTVYGSNPAAGANKNTAVTGAALYSPNGLAYWGNGITPIPDKGNQNDTLDGDAQAIDNS